MKDHLTWLTYVWPLTNPFLLTLVCGLFKIPGFLAGGISTTSSLLPFFGTRLRRQNFNLTPTQYRQLCRLASNVELLWRQYQTNKIMKKSINAGLKSNDYNSFYPWKVIWILQYRKFLLIEFGVMGFGIWNSALGVQKPANNSNPESKFHRQGIQNPVVVIWNP